MKRLPFVVLLTFSLYRAFSQPMPTIVLTQLTEENGLSDNHVQCVLKDRQGLVWIGTADGLNLLDGSSIKVFRHNEAEATSLPNNVIFSLAEDDSGNVWMGTAAGPACYSKSRDAFTAVGLPQSPYGASNIVKSISIDKQQRVWCGTDGGLFAYDPQAKKTAAYYNLSPDEAHLAVNKIVNTLPDGATIWLCTYDGLWEFDTRRLQFRRAAGKANDAGYEGLTDVVYKDKGGRIWFGNWSAGLKQWRGAAGAVIDYGSLPGAATNVVGINEMELPDGRTVLCLNGGLVCFDGRRFFRLPKPAALAESPPATGFYRSADGWLWMTTDKGLFIYNPKRQFFQHHFFPHPVTSQSVSFIEGDQGLLIGGQGRNFLTAYDEAGVPTNTFSGLLRTAAPGDGDKTKEAALCLVKESANTLLITNSGGILRYNFKNGSAKWFTHKKTDSTTIPKNFIQHLFIDSRNAYWVFPWREGIYNMRPSTGKCTLLCKGFLQEGGKPKGLLIADAAEDEGGNIWMADLDEGIVLFDRRTDKFSKPFASQTGGRVHSSKIFYRNGFCYSFANDKLLKWSTKSRVLEQVPLPPQAGGYIFDLLIDRQDRWWMATKKGLLSYTESTRTFKQFTTADGLLNNDMDGNFYQKSNGDVLFGTPAYFTQFTPAALLRSSASSATVLVTAMEAAGQRMVYDSTKTTSLNYTQANLVFHWAVTDYTSPFHNQYWCRLQGIDADWKYVGNKGEMQYANLSPGVYTLLLKAATANGVAADNVITVRFNISPPFWKAVWFWALWVALAGCILYWQVSRRIKGIKAKAAIRQQMSELELKALKAQMNPHFIFNSLSSIQESILSGNTEAASGYLGKFSKLIRAVLENSDKRLITLPQEVDYLKLYLELESFRFDDFNFSLEATDVDDAAFIRLPPMLVQPYVENAIKHGLSHKEGAKKLAVLFNQVEPNLLQVVIEDNGVGRRQAAVINEARIASHRSMGMKITEERLGLQKDSGRRPVEIKDLTNGEGKPTGTRITVYIAIEN